MFSTPFNLQRPMKSHHLCNFVLLRDKSADGPTPNILSSLSLSLKSKRRRNLERVDLQISRSNGNSLNVTNLQISNANGRNKLWALAEPWTRRRTTAGEGRRRRQRRKRNRYNSHRVSWRVSRPLRLRKALLFAFVFWFVLQSKKRIFLFIYLIVKLTINVKFLLELLLLLSKFQGELKD